MFVYVGAVAVLMVFTILFTRRDSEQHPRLPLERRHRGHGGIWRVDLGHFRTQALSVAAPEMQALTVRHIGEILMTDYVWPLQCVGLLLTAALLGALMLVMEEKR